MPSVGEQVLYLRRNGTGCAADRDRTLRTRFCSRVCSIYCVDILSPMTGHPAMSISSRDLSDEEPASARRYAGTIAGEILPAFPVQTDRRCLSRAFPGPSVAHLRRNEAHLHRVRGRRCSHHRFDHNRHRLGTTSQAEKANAKWIGRRTLDFSRSPEMSRTWSRASRAPAVGWHRSARARLHEGLFPSPGCRMSAW